MYWIALCDDSPQDLEKTAAVTRSVMAADGAACQMDTYTSSEQMLWDLEEKIVSPDILLLDIEMPQISGMELGFRLQELLNGTLIIFVTDHMRYVLDAFELPVFRYVPKSELENRLPRALRDAVQVLDLDTGVYMIHRGNTVERISHGSIYYIDRSGKNAQLHAKDGIHAVRKSLDKVMSDLDSDDFVFLDRGIIANLAWIEAIRSGEALLSTGMTLPISRKRLADVKQRFTWYWGRQL